jgi:putative phosphoesterase
MPSKPLWILVLADTHNHLPPNISEIAKGVDEIWHLGDVCASSVLEKLEELGPAVTLVRGNCDSNSDWPLVVDLIRNGVRFRLVHIPPSRGPENIEVLLHGHTHVPRNERRGDVLFLNPGCVTRPNRGAPASAAYLDIRLDGGIDWRLFELR